MLRCSVNAHRMSRAQSRTMHAAALKSVELDSHDRKASRSECSDPIHPACWCLMRHTKGVTLGTL
eukprot:1160795-Pelagomonas_calceolata.AAC.1